MSKFCDALHWIWNLKFWTLLTDISYQIRTTFASVPIALKLPMGFKIVGPHTTSSDITCCAASYNTWNAFPIYFHSLIPSCHAKLRCGFRANIDGLSGKPLPVLWDTRRLKEDEEHASGSAGIYPRAGLLKHYLRQSAKSLHARGVTPSQLCRWCCHACCRMRCGAGTK